MEKLIITVAPTGSMVTRKMTPHVPITPEEVASTVYECYKAGASVAHIHARDEEGKPTHDEATFREIIRLIREKCDVVIQLSTGARSSPGLPSSYADSEKRVTGVRLRPEMASLTTGSVNFPDSVYLNTPEVIENLARTMKEYGVKPEIEVFDVSMVSNALELVRKGLICKPLHFDFVMGLRGAIPATPKNLVHLVECIPPGSTWTVAGIGRHQLPLSVLAIVMCGHVRVGLEDNIYYARDMLATNTQLVERVVRLAKELGREVATPDEARRILNLPKPSP